jgi:hypothetical protein
MNNILIEKIRRAGRPLHVSVMEVTLMQDMIHESQHMLLVFTVAKRNQQKARIASVSNNADNNCKNTEEVAYITTNGDLILPSAIAKQMPKTLSSWGKFRNASLSYGDMDEVIGKIALMASKGWLDCPLMQSPSALIALDTVCDLLHWEAEALMSFANFPIEDEDVSVFDEEQTAASA